MCCGWDCVLLESRYQHPLSEISYTQAPFEKPAACSHKLIGEFVAWCMHGPKSASKRPYVFLFDSNNSSSGATTELSLVMLETRESNTSYQPKNRENFPVFSALNTVFSACFFLVSLSD